MSCEVFRIYLKLNMIVFLRTMWSMSEDRMHIPPMFPVPKLISIMFMKIKIIQEGITVHDLGKEKSFEKVLHYMIYISY